MASRDAQQHTTAVQVAVRVRPLSEKDRAIPRFSNMSESDVLKIQNSSLNVIPHQKTFTFDYVFGPNSTQDEIFVTLASPLIHKFIDGYNVTILAYGQTSSGKTYTMGTAQHGDTDDLQQEGIIPRAMSLLFETLNRSSTPGLRNGRSKLEKKFRPLSVPAAFDDLRRNKSSIKVSFVEIYNEDLVDLLNPAPPSERPLVTIREDSKGQIYWSGVRELPVENTNDVLNFLEQGTQNRATGATDMNEKSSRSHAIFSVTLRQEKWVPSSGQSSPIMSLQRSPSPSVSGNKASGIRRPESSIGFRPPDNAEDGEWIITHSKFHFVDLAGSERLKRTAAEGDRRKEGININGGLLALGNVISALGDPSKKSTHVPYRDSKLTRLLQDSLGGNATTLMIACVSPAEYNLIETVNTLMYANRARNIRNRLEKNEFEEWQTNDNVEFLRGVITKLKAELRAAKTASITSSTISKDMTASSLSLASDGHSSPSTIPDMDQVFLDQRNEIMNLQHLIEKLEGELAVTHEREQVAEEQLKQMWKTDQGPRPEDIEKLKQEVDFEHLVEPVIEEYEKSISVLESQLAMARAALHHSDIGFEEQSARIVHQEQINESQSHIIEELKARISKVVEREQSNDLYIQELESKLSKASQETIRDQESLNDLKTKLSKLTETEESTEQYIVTLEQRLANVEKEKDSLVDTVQALEMNSAAKDSSNQALKLRLEQAERGDDKKMLLLELDDALQRYQELESEHGALRVKYEALVKSNTANGDHKQQTDENGDIQNAEQDSTMDKAQKRLSRSFQEEVNAHQQAVEVVEKEKQIVTLNAQIAHLQKDLSVLESENQETHKKLDITVKAHAEATSQIEKLEKIVQEHLANAEEENLMSSEPEEVAVVGLHEEMERELVSSKQREQVLQSEVEKVQQELQLLTSKLTVQENDRSQLQHAVADVQQKLEAAQAEIQDASARQQDLNNNFDAERALLQKSASHLESEIELLKLERAGLKAQIETIQAEVNKYEAEKATAAVEAVPKIANGHAVVNHVDKTDVDGLQQKLVDRENLLLELNETVSTLQKQLSESTLSTQTLTQKVLDLTNAQEEAAKISVAYSELNTKHHELQQELDAHKEQLTGSQELSTSLRKQLDDSVAAQKTLSQQLSDLATTVSQSEDSAKEHEAQYADLLAKLKATEDQLDTSNKSIVSLQSELAGSVAASATLMQKLSESANAKAPSTSAEDFEIKYQQLQAQLHESEASHNLTRESIQLLQKQMDESNTANSQLTQQLAELTNAQVQPNLNESYQKERAELQLQLEAREAELAELNEYIQTKQTQHNESVSALHATNAKLAEQVSQHADAQYGLKDSYEKQQQELQQKLDASESELAELNEHIQTLQKQHEESISVLHATNAKLAEQLSQHADAQYGLKDSYEKQQQELQQKLDASESELAELNELIQTLQKQHEESISALEEANANLMQQLSEYARTDAQSNASDVYEKECQNLQLKLDSSETRFAELNQRIQSLQKQYDESISALEIANAKLSSHSPTETKANLIPEAEHQRVLDDLQIHVSKLAASTEKSEGLQKDLDEMKISHSAIHQQLADLTATLSGTEAEVRSLQSVVEEKSTAARESELRGQQLQSENDSGAASLKELSDKHDTALQRLSELEQQHSELQYKHDLVANERQSILEQSKLGSQTLQSSIDEMAKRMESLQTDKDDVESKLMAQQELIQTLQSTMTELSSGLEDMRAARDSAEQNLEIQRERTGQVQSALEKQLEITSNLEASISEMKFKLAEIEAEAAEAAVVARSTHQREREEEVELYENAIMELESKLQNVYADHSESQKASTARHNEAELQLTKIREEIVERDMFIVELEKSVDKMENELKVSAEMLKEKSDAYLHLQQVADGHESEIARLGQELGLAKQKINDNESEKLQILDQKLKALQEETEEYNVLIEQMDSDIQTKSAEMEEIIAELAAAESAKVQSQARVKELEQELLEVRSAIVEPPSVERNVAGVDDQVSAYQAQLADANAQLKEVSQEKAALSGQLEQLTVDNAQLQAKLSIIENKLETQSLKMSKEAEDLRQEIGKLLAKNDQLEKEVLPQLNNKRSSRTFAATRDSTTSIVSPPQTPRITSSSPDTLQNKLKLHENTIAQQASLIKTLEDKVQQSVSTSRASLDVNRSPTVTDKLTMRKSASSPSLPPPPSEPLPPLPVVLGHAKATSISSMKSGSTPDESQHSASISTTEQFEKTIRSLQKKLSAAEMDVKAHLEVITKLEQQLFRAENALKENMKRASFSPTRASTSDDSEVDKLKKQVEQASAQLTSQQEKSAKDLKKVQDDLDAERKAREKAEKARVILENRIDQLMSKKSKFMCF